MISEALTVQEEEMPQQPAPSRDVQQTNSSGIQQETQTQVNKHIYQVNMDSAINNNKKSLHRKLDYMKGMLDLKRKPKFFSVSPDIQKRRTVGGFQKMNKTQQQMKQECQNQLKHLGVVGRNHRVSNQNNKNSNHSPQSYFDNEQHSNSHEGATSLGNANQQSKYNKIRFQDMVMDQQQDHYQHQQAVMLIPIDALGMISASRGQNQNNSLHSSQNADLLTVEVPVPQISQTTVKLARNQQETSTTLLQISDSTQHLQHYNNHQQQQSEISPTPQIAENPLSFQLSQLNDPIAIEQIRVEKACTQQYYIDNTSPAQYDMSHIAKQNISDYHLTNTLLQDNCNNGLSELLAQQSLNEHTSNADQTSYLEELRVASHQQQTGFESTIKTEKSYYDAYMPAVYRNSASNQNNSSSSKPSQQQQHQLPSPTKRTKKTVVAKNNKQSSQQIYALTGQRFMNLSQPPTIPEKGKKTKLTKQQAATNQQVIEVPQLPKQFDLSLLQQQQDLDLYQGLNQHLILSPKHHSKDHSSSGEGYKNQQQQIKVGEKRNSVETQQLSAMRSPSNANTAQNTAQNASDQQQSKQQQFRSIPTKQYNFTDVVGCQSNHMAPFKNLKQQQNLSYIRLKQTSSVEPQFTEKNDGIIGTSAIKKNWENGSAMERETMMMFRHQTIPIDDNLQSMQRFPSVAAAAAETIIIKPPDIEDPQFNQNNATNTAISVQVSHASRMLGVDELPIEQQLKLKHRDSSQNKCNSRLDASGIKTKETMHHEESEYHAETFGNIDNSTIGPGEDSPAANYRAIAELFPGIKATDRLINEVWSSDQNTNSNGNTDSNANDNGRSVSSQMRKDFSLSMIKSDGSRPMASFKTELLLQQSQDGSDIDSYKQADQQLNQKARNDRNIQFLHYIRDQMYQEYGVDLNGMGTPKYSKIQSNTISNALVKDGPLNSLKKLKQIHKEQLIDKKKCIPAAASTQYKLRATDNGSRNMTVSPTRSTKQASFKSKQKLNMSFQKTKNTSNSISSPGSPTKQLNQAIQNQKQKKDDLTIQKILKDSSQKEGIDIHQMQKIGNLLESSKHLKQLKKIDTAEARKLNLVILKSTQQQQQQYQTNQQNLHLQKQQLSSDDGRHTLYATSSARNDNSKFGGKTSTHIELHETKTVRKDDSSSLQVMTARNGGAPFILDSKYSTLNPRVLKEMSDQQQHSQLPIENQLDASSFGVRTSSRRLKNTSDTMMTSRNYLQFPEVVQSATAGGAYTGKVYGGGVTLNGGKIFSNSNGKNNTKHTTSYITPKSTTHQRYKDSVNKLQQQLLQANEQQNDNNKKQQLQQQKPIICGELRVSAHFQTLNHASNEDRQKPSQPTTAMPELNKQRKSILDEILNGRELLQQAGGGGTSRNKDTKKITLAHPSKKNNTLQNTTPRIGASKTSKNSKQKIQTVTLNQFNIGKRIGMAANQQFMMTATASMPHHQNQHPFSKIGGKHYKTRLLKLNTESSEDLHDSRLLDDQMTFNDGKNSPERMKFNIEGVKTSNKFNVMSWESDDGEGKHKVKNNNGKNHNFAARKMGKTTNSSFSPVKNKNGTESIQMEIVYQ